MNVPIGDLEFTFSGGSAYFKEVNWPMVEVFLLAMLSELPQDGSVDLTTAEKLVLSEKSEKIIPNNRKPCTSPPIDNLEII